MRRNILVALVAIGALCLGVVAILRHQVALGACFIGLGLLRALMLFQRRKLRKPVLAVRLNLKEDKPGHEGPQDR